MTLVLEGIMTGISMNEPSDVPQAADPCGNAAVEKGQCGGKRPGHDTYRKKRKDGRRYWQMPGLIGETQGPSGAE
jgi:hypothetical protein